MIKKIITTTKLVLHLPTPRQHEQNLDVIWLQWAVSHVSSDQTTRTGGHQAATSTSCPLGAPQLCDGSLRSLASHPSPLHCPPIKMALHYRLAPFCPPWHRSSSRELWRLLLKPREERMSASVKHFLSSLSGTRSFTAQHHHHIHSHFLTCLILFFYCTFQT